MKPEATPSAAVWRRICYKIKSQNTFIGGLHTDWQISY